MRDGHLPHPPDPGSPGHAVCHHRPPHPGRDPGPDDGLAHDPEKQGKALPGAVQGFRSLRAAGQGYRIIYRAHQSHVPVVVVAVGLRREGGREDVYRLAQRLLRLGLLG